MIKFEKCNMKVVTIDEVYSIAEFWNIMLNYFSVYFRLVLVHWYDKMMRSGSAATSLRGPMMSR